MGDVVPFVPLNGGVKKWHVTLQKDKRYKAMILYRVDPRAALRDCMKEMKCKKMGMYDFIEVMEELNGGELRLAYDNTSKSWTKSYGGDGEDASITVGTKPGPVANVAKLVTPAKATKGQPIYLTDMEDSKERMSYRVVKDA